MASNIDATKPRDKDDLSQSVSDIRGNFGAAKTEIEALQTDLDTEETARADGDAALQQAINDHVDDPTGAHAASAISFASAVAGFTPTEVKAALDALAGVRIVDHNLDVDDPPNGYYVRWANGLQACFTVATIPGDGWTLVSSSGIYYSATESFDWPAEFLDIPYPISGNNDAQLSGRSSWVTHLKPRSSRFEVTLAALSTHTQNVTVYVAGIGRAA